MKKLLMKNLFLTLSLVFILSMMKFNASKVFASTNSDFVIDAKGVLVQYNGPGGAVVIPDGVTKIGDYAFSNSRPTYPNLIPNTTLTSITIPNSVKEIGNGAFEYCTSLSSVIIPNSVTSIGYDAFYKCTNLNSAVISNNVRHIGTGAFNYCTSLANVNIPTGLREIGLEVFGHTNLTSITIPSNIKIIQGTAFDGCANLNNITIPNSVESIGGYAFANCTSLTDITIPDSVEIIDDFAFKGCNNLKSITISGGTTSLNPKAFSGLYITIYGKSKSFAEAYAATNNIPFISNGIVSQADQLYTIAYNSVNMFQNYKTQKDINTARMAINNLNNTDASWAIGQFSHQVDLVQQPILVRAITAITTAQNNPSQRNVNAAKAAIDPYLPQIWKNAYSSAVDVVEQVLMKNAVDATNKAIQTKLQADIDAANLIIRDIKTATDPSISSWADTLIDQLSGIK